MRIRRDGFVYRTAYFWHEIGKPWKQVNLCVLFWLFVSSLLIFVLFALFWVIIGLPLSLISIPFFGHRVIFLWESCDGLLGVFWEPLFRPIKRWPRWRKSGQRIMPGIYLILSLFLLLAGLIIYKIIEAAVWLIGWSWSISPAVPFASLALISVLAVIIVPRFRRSEAGQLLTKYPGAKIKKLCPLVEIV